MYICTYHLQERFAVWKLNNMVLIMGPVLSSISAQYTVTVGKSLDIKPVGEITVGHRTFSEHFRHLSDQKSIRSAKLSERATSNERPRARVTRARALIRHICFTRSINHEENYKSCSVRQ